MNDFIIKTATADDPIYKERISVSSGLGSIMVRARENYLKRIEKSQKGLESNDRKIEKFLG